MQQPVLDLAYLRSIAEGTWALEEELFRLFYQTADRCTARLAVSITEKMTRNGKKPRTSSKARPATLVCVACRIFVRWHARWKEVSSERLRATLQEALKELGAYVSELRYAS